MDGGQTPIAITDNDLVQWANVKLVESYSMYHGEGDGRKTRPLQDVAAQIASNTGPVMGDGLIEEPKTQGKSKAQTEMKAAGRGVAVRNKIRTNATSVETPASLRNTDVKGPVPPPFADITPASGSTGKKVKSKKQKAVVDDATQQHGNALNSTEIVGEVSPSQWRAYYKECAEYFKQCEAAIAAQDQESTTQVTSGIPAPGAQTAAAATMPSMAETAFLGCNANQSPMASPLQFQAVAPAQPLASAFPASASANPFCSVLPTSSGPSCAALPYGALPSHLHQSPQSTPAVGAHGHSYAGAYGIYGAPCSSMFPPTCSAPCAGGLQTPMFHSTTVGPPGFAAAPPVPYSVHGTPFAAQGPSTLFAETAARLSSNTCSFKSANGTLDASDDTLMNLLMAWYYSGYYTGLYSAQQRK